MNTPDIIIVLLVMGFVLLATYVGVNIAFGTNDTSTTPTTLADPNTVITFCEWNHSEDFVDCTQDRYWHDNNYEVIRHESSHYSISIQDYRDGKL